MRMALVETAREHSGEGADEASLVRGALAHETGAFREIMRRHNRRLFRVARSVTRDDSEAEDVVQETYLHAYAALGSFRGEAGLGTWLTRIALNEAMGRIRKRRVTTDLDSLEAMPPAQILFLDGPPSDDPERAAARRQLRGVIEAAVDHLPQPFRTVFVLRDMEGLSVEETALSLGLKPDTVKTRLHRARRLLRRTLNERFSDTLSDTFPFAGARCERIIARVEAILAERGLPI
jgi:RNA polymerase sigma-70 factor (ECF subfamily)